MAPARFRFPSPQLPLALIPFSLFLPTDERDLCGGERVLMIMMMMRMRIYNDNDDDDDDDDAMNTDNGNNGDED